MTVKVLKQDYHRNGIGGAGFVVSLVEWPDAIVGRFDLKNPRFVAISSLDEDGEAAPASQREYMREHTFVLNIEALFKGSIDMFDANHPNAWRGADYVGPAVVQAWREACRSGKAFGTGSKFGYDPFDDTWQPDPEPETLVGLS